MTYAINETHDANLVSWVESAGRPDTDFPIQNLPLGIFRRKGSADHPRAGIAIGESVLDLDACARERLLRESTAEAANACGFPTLNALMALGPEHWSSLRLAASRLLRRSDPPSRAEELQAKILVPTREVELLLPAAIGDYTDFYASLHHALNVGSMFRPDNPLFPNYRHLPVAYHGRASSVVVSGTPVRRPFGQIVPGADAQPAFSASRRLDYELEMGFFIGPGNALGERVPIAEAERRVFGACLLNDWSARDIQRWEYQPLGPFLGKSFATTVSPWVVTLEALQPFRCAPPRRQPGDPALLDYLAPADDEPGFRIELEVRLSSAAMRQEGTEPALLSRVSYEEMYWTLSQMIAHHTSNGCNLRPGDLVGSGTVSGSGKNSRGCLLELAWQGKEPVGLPDGGSRQFLHDGDEVSLRGYCAKPGFRRISFGECRGIVIPAEP